MKNTHIINLILDLKSLNTRFRQACNDRLLSIAEYLILEIWEPL